MWDTTEGDRIRSAAFGAMNLLTGMAGVLTLVVGAIGVGNLMFIVVRRRTREIGIQMAMGARPRWILIEFLVQALVLVGAGGLVGFLGAWIMAAVIGASPLVEALGTPRISAWIGLGTVALLGLVGLLAGFFPARRASRLDPVRALND
jgi:putative ABC transport system permease protein